MVTRNDGQARGKYTLEFKMEAVRLVEGGQASAVTAKVQRPYERPNNLHHFVLRYP